MNTDWLMGILLILFIIIIGIWIIVESRKKTWYKVYQADNNVRLLYRDFNSRMWRTSDRYMRFKDEWGHEVTYPSGAHWVIMWEEIKPEELEVAKDEIRRMKEEYTEVGGL